MKSIFTLCGVSLLFFSCETISERKPVPPQGSEFSDFPWNTPQEGEGGGALGGFLNQQGR